MSVCCEFSKVICSKILVLNARIKAFWYTNNLKKKYFREQGVSLEGWPTKPGNLGQQLEDIFTADTDTLR